MAGKGNLFFCGVGEENGCNFLFSSDRREDAKVHVVENKNLINATCKFTDDSRVLADRGEAISEGKCLITIGRKPYIGEGRVTAANNYVEGDNFGNVRLYASIHAGKAFAEHPDAPLGTAEI